MARKFQFRLEAIRKLRERAERAQQRVLAESIQQAQSTQARHDELGIRLRRADLETRTTQEVGALDLRAIREHQLHRAWLLSEKERLTDELVKRQAVVEAERSKLVEAAQQRKVLEKLRERREAAHHEMVQREEQASTDEIAILTHSRQGPFESGEDR